MTFVLHIGEHDAAVTLATFALNPSLNAIPEKTGYMLAPKEIHHVQTFTFGICASATDLDADFRHPKGP